MSDSKLPKLPNDVFHAFRLFGPDLDLQIVPHTAAAARAIEQNADLRKMTTSDWLKDEIVTALIRGKAT